MKLLKAIGAGALAFLWAYMVGAFMSASLDISMWSEFARGLTGLMGGLFSFMATTFVLSETL